MSKYMLMAAILMLGAAPLSAEENQSVFKLGDDRFLAGSSAIQSAADVDDLFMFGATVRSEQDITGSAHLFARSVHSTGLVGGDAYIAGMNVNQAGKVVGDLTISGYTVHVGEVAGDLRASAAKLTLSGPILGYAIVAAEEVEFNGSVAGDVSLTAKEVAFSEDARIEGTLVVYEQQTGELKIPARVASEDRVQRRDISEWSDAASEVELWNWRNALGEFLVGVLIIAVIAAILAAIMPQRLADLRRRILEQPLRNLLLGFLALSTVIGLNIVLLISGIGIVALPLSLLIAFIVTFAGYVVGSYAVGVAILLFAKQAEPANFSTRVLAAGIGAFAAGFLALIPFLGWLLVLAITFAGLGSITIWLFRPEFFSMAEAPS